MKHTRKEISSLPTIKQVETERKRYRRQKAYNKALSGTIYVDKLYAVMDEQERRQLMESLISEIQIFEERKPNGQWLKSIKFKLPIIEEDMEISLDNDAQVETVALLERI